MTLNLSGTNGDAPNKAPHIESLSRAFSFRSVLALAFADVSPIVAIYTVFAISIYTAGPRFFWAYPVALLGQLMVAAVFGELASRWPYAGSVYQWARHIHSWRAAAWGWAAAWAYIWGFTIALAVIAYAAAGFLLDIFGISAPGKWTTVLTALAIIAVFSWTNMLSRKILEALIVGSIICEILGSVGLGILLLIFHRVNSWSTLFQGLPQTHNDWHWGPMLGVLAFASYAIVGFESAGSIAEEVHEPERHVPKAIIGSLAAVGAVVLFASMSLILSIPDLNAVLTKQTDDPVAVTLYAHFGPGLAKPLLFMFIIGFSSSFMAVQAAVSRCIWGMARDRALPASNFFARLAGAERLPINAVGLTAVIAAGLVLFSGSSLYNVLVTGSGAGMYISFAIPVLGAAFARLGGKWTPGRFNLGPWGSFVTYGAAIWMILAIINLVWPWSQPGQAWYITWAIPILTVGLGAIGTVIYQRVNSDMHDPVGVRLGAQLVERVVEDAE